MLFYIGKPIFAEPQFLELRFLLVPSSQQLAAEK